MEHEVKGRQKNKKLSKQAPLYMEFIIKMR